MSEWDVPCRGSIPFALLVFPYWTGDGEETLELSDVLSIQCRLGQEIRVI